MKPYLKRAWAEINLSALEDNIKAIKAMLYGGTNIMGVIKADAYGHGEDVILRKLWDCGVKDFAVSNLDEAVSVRKHCPSSEILILGYTPPEYAKELEYNNIIQGVVSLDYARELSANAIEKVRCHIKIDTGMGRIGLKYPTPELCADEAEKIIATDKICVEGIYTHFAVADAPDDEESCSYTDAQADFIIKTGQTLSERGHKLRHLHFLNSAGICYHNNPASTLARAGIIMYGLYPNYPAALPIKLRPVMALKAVISHVKTVNSGDTISYGRTYTAKGGERIATVTVGYADGYSRLLSGKACVLVRGVRCPVVGRICMDQLMLDVSAVPDAKPGEIVTLIGRDGNEEITADQLASLYNTIGYEVICGISKRVPRIYIED